MLSLLDIFENDETEQNNENQRGCFNFSIFLSFCEVAENEESDQNEEIRGYVFETALKKF